MTDAGSVLPPATLRVQDAARALGLDIAAREMADSTRTAEDAAAACGVTVGQIVKSLVFLGAQDAAAHFTGRALHDWKTALFLERFIDRWLASDLRGVPARQAAE